MKTKKKNRPLRNQGGKVVQFGKQNTREIHMGLNDTASLEAAFNLIQSNTPDVLFLELVLSGRESRDMIRHLKNDFYLKRIETFEFSTLKDATNVVSELTPVIGDSSKFRFSDDISVAKVRAVPKKKSGNPFLQDGTFRVHNMVIIPSRREVYVEGKKVNLTLTMFNILNYLALKPGWVFTYDQIIDATRGLNANVLESSVKTHVCMMRKRLGPASKYIETVPGVGYRIRDDADGHERSSECIET
jgi:two-component system phosphate regulon response regulator PhoB